MHGLAVVTTTGSGVLALAGIALVGILCQWLAWRVRVPAILFLLIAGVIAGPVSGWIDPDALFGDLLFPFVSLSVAVILFEGALTLRLKELRGHGGVVRRLVGPGMLLTWAVAALAAYWAVGFRAPIAALFGALVVVTGPTVITPLLRTVRPRRNVAEVLRWEGITIDPIGALLAVLVFEFLVAREQGGAWMHVASLFAQVLGAGLVVGGGAGWLWAVVLRREWVPDFLRNVTTLAVVAGVFAGADLLAPEAGLLAVTVLGMTLANLPRVPVDEILDFKESLSLLLISSLFVILAARVDFAQFEALGWGALLVLAAIQFLARPLTVALSTAGSSLEMRERALLAWIAPRGIIAAAVSAAFAPRMVELGFAEAELLVPMVFAVIVGTVVLQSLTAAPLARWLKVAEPEARGFLILGANPVARAIATALQAQDVPVVLADTNRDNIVAARMEGLDAWYGNPMSERGEQGIEWSPLGGLLALTPNRNLNLLAVRHYRPLFGAKNVYRIRGRLPKQRTTSDVLQQQLNPPQSQHGRVLFGDHASWPELTKRLRAGAQIKATNLTEEFGWEDWVSHNPDALPLFALDAKDRVFPYLSGHSEAATVETTAFPRVLALVSES